MKAYLIIIFFLLFIFVSKAFSYTESLISDWISSALSNPATKSMTKSSITEYCDCAVTAIIDEGKEIRESGYNCELISFK